MSVTTGAATRINAPAVTVARMAGLARTRSVIAPQMPPSLFSLSRPIIGKRSRLMPSPRMASNAGSSVSEAAKAISTTMITPTDIETKMAESVKASPTSDSTTVIPA